MKNRNQRQIRSGCAALVLGTLALCPQAQAAPAPTPSEDFTELSLDTLLDLEVISVSRRSEPLGQAAAAIHVLTGEEIRRSGANSIAEALRMVPGMDVARTGSNSYALSARGFQNTSDKLQVLVDGRSVYTPLTSSVFWDALDTDLGSIDRIEVIRGPGATLWGANAVNGVINIITLPAAAESRGEGQIAAGNEEKISAQLRAGAAAGESGALRFYAKARERDISVRADGSPALDGQRFAQGGLRGDWDLGAEQQLSVMGDYYSARSQTQGVQSDRVPVRYSGASLNTQWSQPTGKDGRLSALISYDHYERDAPESFYESRDTYDLGLQHDTRLGARHQVTYGVGYRYSSDETGGPPRAILFLPARRNIDVLSAFAQDQIQLGRNLTWTLGGKLEHNDFTGTEFQPGTRLGWTLSPSWFTWTAVSRAVRTPNRLDHDVAILCPADSTSEACPPNTIVPVGSRDFDSETLVAYEWGLRYSAADNWSVDLATFYNDYRDLRSIEFDGNAVSFQNRLHGQGAGGELTVAWRPLDELSLLVSYSLLDLDIEPGSSTDGAGAQTIEGGSPKHQAGLRWYYSPAASWSADGFLRYVGAMAQTAHPAGGPDDSSVPAYTELNLRLARRLSSQLEVALTGTNLLHGQHPEYGAASTRGELERSVQLGLAWNWQ